MIFKIGCFRDILLSSRTFHRDLKKKKKLCSLKYNYIGNFYDAEFLLNNSEISKIMLCQDFLHNETLLNSR